MALQADELQDGAIRDVLQDVTHRVRSMALVHEKLYQSADLANVDFAEYAQSLLNYLWRVYGGTTGNIRLALDLEPVTLTVNAAVPCGLILRNQTKILRVRDSGVGLPAGFDWRGARSLGLRLVQMLAQQINADVAVVSGKGTEFTVTIGKTTHEQNHHPHR